VRDPNVVKQMTEQGAEVVATTPAEFAASSRPKPSVSARWCERSARRLSDYTDDEQSDAEAINSFAADGLRRSRGETRPHLPQKVAGTK